MSILNILTNYSGAFLGGLWVTIKLTLIVSVIGIVVGVLIGVLSSQEKNGFGRIMKIITFIFSSIPVMVLLLWFHFPLQSILGVMIDPFWTAALALSILNTLFVAEIISNALNIFPKSYTESARTLGISKIQTVFKIQIPIIMRQVLSGIISLQANVLHMTLFASLISVQEIFRVAQSINAIEYKPVEIYSLLIVFFLIILLPINGLAYYINRKYSRDLLAK